MPANVAGNMGMREDVDTTRDVVGVGDVGTTTLVVEAEAGGTGE